MPLGVGDRVGPYDITAKIGEGGTYVLAGSRSKSLALRVWSTIV